MRAADSALGGKVPVFVAAGQRISAIADAEARVGLNSLFFTVPSTRLSSAAIADTEDWVSSSAEELSAEGLSSV